MTWRPIPIALVACIVLLTPATRAGSLTVSGCKCEYCTNPLGLDTCQPRLSWLLDSRQRGQRQTAYQILAASDPALLAKDTGDLWDSGKVASASRSMWSMAGQPLHSGQRVYWKVRAWDREGRPSAYSTPAWWEMGSAGSRRIGRPRGSRASRRRRGRSRRCSQTTPRHCCGRSLPLDKKIRRARVYVSGLGYYELHLNGQRVGDHVLDPGWTTYSKRVLYSTYDVTDQLQRGPQRAGRHARQRLVQSAALAHVGPHQPARSPDHRRSRAPSCSLSSSSPTARRRRSSPTRPGKSGAGPILRNSVYLGEVYDARREQPGWDRPGFDDSGWEPARQRERAARSLAGTGRPADPRHPHAQAGRAHRAQAGRVHLRPGAELRRLGAAAASRAARAPGSACATGSCFTRTARSTA